MKKIRITYEIVTEESAENADVEESGWEDKDGVDCTPDKWDEEDGLTAVDKAVDLINSKSGEGEIEASCSGRMTEHCWWTAYKVAHDDEGEKSRGFHPVGFSEDEINEINEKLKQ